MILLERFLEYFLPQCQHLQNAIIGSCIYCRGTEIGTNFVAVAVVFLLLSLAQLTQLLLGAGKRL